MDGGFGILKVVNDSVSVEHVFSTVQLQRYAEPVLASNCNGELLFYVSLGILKNRLHNVIQNGDTISSGFLAANGIPGASNATIKVPKNDSLYYVFSSQNFSNLINGYAYATIEYAIINMNANGGLGSVVSKYNILADSTSTGFTIIRHANKIWYWLLNFNIHNQTIQAYLITENGISWHHQQVLNILPITTSVWQGQNPQFVPSPRGNRVLFKSLWHANDFYLYDFDNQNGLLSNQLTLYASRFHNNARHLGVAEFSANSQKLYMYFENTGNVSTSITQVDLTDWQADSIYNSIVTMGGGYPNYRMVYPANNGKIYLGVRAGQHHYHLARIDSPDYEYPANHVVDTVLYYYGFGIGNTYHQFNFSRFPGHYYLPDRYGISAENFCWGDTTRFDLNDYDNLGGISWDFGDPSSGNNSSNDTAPFHIFSGPGSYTVTAYATYCSRQDTLTKQITITGQPNHSGLKDTTLCAGETYLAEHAGISGMRYRWWDNDSIPQKSISQSGWYWLETSNACYSRIDSFYVNFEQPPQTGLPADTSLCAGDVLYLAPQPGNYRWHWNDGDSLPKTITQAGQYILIANNSCGSFPFTVQVHERQPPQFSTPPDTTLCEGQVIRVELDEQYQTNYLWQDGSTERIRLLSDSGFYSVTGSNPCGNSSGSFSIQTEDCACNIYIPNAFTPNGDGLNEVFKLESRCEMQQFELSIYNRWGEKVFQSQQLNHYWDGRIQGKPAPPGNYVYVLFYHREGLGPRRTSGNVLVQY